MPAQKPSGKPSMDLQEKAEVWKKRIFQMIIFYVVMGMIVLAIAVTMVSNMMNQIIPH